MTLPPDNRPLLKRDERAGADAPDGDAGMRTARNQPVLMVPGLTPVLVPPALKLPVPGCRRWPRRRCAAAA